MIDVKIEEQLFVNELKQVISKEPQKLSLNRRIDRPTKPFIQIRLTPQKQKLLITVMQRAVGNA